MLFHLSGPDAPHWDCPDLPLPRRGVLGGKSPHEPPLAAVLRARYLSDTYRREKSNAQPDWGRFGPVQSGV